MELSGYSDTKQHLDCGRYNFYHIFVDRLESFMGIPTGDSKNTLEDGQDTVTYEQYKTFEDDSESDFSDFDEMFT